MADFGVSRAFLQRLGLGTLNLNTEIFRLGAAYLAPEATVFPTPVASVVIPLLWQDAELKGAEISLIPITPNTLINSIGLYLQSSGDLVGLSLFPAYRTTSGPVAVRVLGGVWLSL